MRVVDKAQEVSLALQIVTYVVCCDALFVDDLDSNLDARCTVDGLLHLCERSFPESALQLVACENVMEVDFCGWLRVEVCVTVCAVN